MSLGFGVAAKMAEERQLVETQDEAIARLAGRVDERSGRAQSVASSRDVPGLLETGSFVEQDMSPCSHRGGCEGTIEELKGSRKLSEVATQRGFEVQQAPFGQRAACGGAGRAPELPGGDEAALGSEEIAHHPLRVANEGP